MDERIMTFADLDALGAEYSTIKKYLLDLVKTFGTLKNATDLLKKATSMTEVRSSIEQLAKANKEAAQSQIALAKATAEAAKAAKDNSQAKLDEVKATILLNREQQRQENAKKKSTKAADEQTRAYKSLVREYTFLRKVAEDYGASLGVNSAKFKETSARAAELNSKLKAIDAAMGNHQRNVGNYKSGFDGLSNSINQISRELPAFANSAQTGFMAISNNLPIFFDAIAQTRKEVAALRAEGKQTEGVLSRLASSIFSWGTALSLAVTLLTFFGKEIGEFFKSLFNGREAMDGFTERQKAINEALSGDQFKDTVADVNKVTTAYELAKKGVISKDEALKVYNKTLGESNGKIRTFTELENTIAKNAEVIVKATMLKAAAQSILSKQAETYGKQLIEERKSNIEAASGFQKYMTAILAFTNVTKGAKENASEAINQIDITGGETRKENIDQLKADGNTLKSVYEQIMGDLANLQKDNPTLNLDIFDLGNGKDDKTKDLTKEIIEAEKKNRLALLKEAEITAREIADNEGNAIKLRLDARKTVFELQKKQIEEEKNFELLALVEKAKQLKEDGATQGQITRLIGEDRKLIMQNASADMKEVEKQLYEDLFNMEYEYHEKSRKEKERILASEEEMMVKFNEKEKKRLKDQIEQMEKSLEKSQNGINKLGFDRLKILEEQRNKGEITEKEYNKRREDIEWETTRFLLQAEIQYTKELIAIMEARGEDVSKLQAKLAEAELGMVRKKNKTELDEEKKKTEDMKRLRSELVGEVVDTLESIATAGFDRRKNQLQEEMDLIDQRTQKEIEGIEASALSEEEKANRISVIRAKAEADRQNLERQQRKADAERAKFERAAAIARVIQQVAIKVIEYGGFTPPAIAVAAIGALQIAQILAQPIPKFKHGTKDSPEGLAIVGDGGRSEVVRLPGGETFLTPSKDTLVNLPAHSQVFSSVEEYDKMMAAAGGSIYREPQKMDDTIIWKQLQKSYKHETDRIVSAINNRPERSTNWTEKGVIERTRKGNMFYEYIKGNILS